MESDPNAVINLEPTPTEEMPSGAVIIRGEGPQSRVGWWRHTVGQRAVATLLPLLAHMPPAERPRKGEKQVRYIPAPPKVNVGRNDPCPCGSDRKFKKCCINKL